MRGFIEISQKKVPKRAFRARLPPNFTKKTSKTSVSFEASDNFHRRRFQNDRFVRGFIEISQKKVPKRAFRARLPRNFTEQASKTSVSRDASDNFTEKTSKRIVSRDASDNFHRKNFQKDRKLKMEKKFPKKWKKIPRKGLDPLLTLQGTNLGGGFKYFYFHPENWGRFSF